MSRGEGIINHGIKGGGSPLLGDFPFVNLCINLCPWEIKLCSIKYPGGVVVPLIMSGGGTLT